jgi:hypothetical protein
VQRPNSIAVETSDRPATPARSESADVRRLASGPKRQRPGVAFAAMSFARERACMGEARISIIRCELAKRPHSATRREAPWRPIG